MQIENKTIFLSHALKDKVLADKLADLLTNGCAVDPNNILCTSLEGKGIPAGTPNFIEYLREQIREPRLVILLLSENYFASLFCLCELGAVWGMGLSCFPLVVPPTNRSKLRATLAVTQAGDITSQSYLDELRDMVKDKVRRHVPTATWSVKRDAFLNGLDDLIKSLPSPTHVPLEKLKAAEDKYKAALEDIRNKEKEIRTLKAQISDLEKCKDCDQVSAVARKYSTDDKVFGELCANTRSALENLEYATMVTLFWSIRGDNYRPKGRDEWDEVREAETREEVYVDDDCCDLNEDHPRVEKAQEALDELQNFLSELKNPELKQRFERENEFPLSLTNKDFWSKFLARI
ncbi:MAG TPA: TIR domain-containing protein [Sedimentisphaerales bacterium]|nr:TIR domain-containing protein [Sedimentisphaerales bacterium]